MKLKTAWLLVAVIGTAQLLGCHKAIPFNPALAEHFFPLRAGSSWTYRIIDRSDGTTDIVTDRALGSAYLSQIKGSGEAVSEYSAHYGARTLVYLREGDYISRLTHLDGPTPILLEEKRLLPELLKPDLRWSNFLFPFGPNSFHATEHHRTFLEANDVVVPAGRFSGCIRVETEAAFQGDGPGLLLKYIDWYAPDVGLIKTSTLKHGSIDWYAPNFGLVETLASRSGFFDAEILRVELLRFGNSPRR